LADTLILIGVIVVVVGGVLGAALWFTRGRPGQTKLVLLDIAGGSEQAHLWVERLRSAGLQARIRNVGDLLAGDHTTPGGSGSSAYEYELWVRPGDEARAREVLGL
jgi:hypothetical protein